MKPAKPGFIAQKESTPKEPHPTPQKKYYTIVKIGSVLRNFFSFLNRYSKIVFTNY